MLDSSRHLIVLGYGSISQGLISLIKTIDPDLASKTIVVAADVPERPHELGGPRYVREILSKANLGTIIAQWSKQGDIVCNLTVGVGTGSLIDYCRHAGLLYLDTSNESWSKDESCLNTFSRRQKVTARKETYAGGPTALICHGANPGLVTHFLKEAILQVARRFVGTAEAEKIYGEDKWGEACRRLRITRIDISERDTQHSVNVAPFKFYNTWSVSGMFEEFFEPPCFAVHSDQLPDGNSRDKLFVQAVGKPVKAREMQGLAIDEMAFTWLPSFQWTEGYVTPHPEAFSMAELCSWDCDGTLEHPTIRFVYRPCDLAVQSLKDKRLYPTLSWEHSILMDEIESGADELGITLYLESGEVYWYGSSLSIEVCRCVVPGNNATSLQVVAGAWAGLQFISSNPNLGLIEAEDIDHMQILALAKPYLGQVIGRWGMWSDRRTDAA